MAKIELRNLTKLFGAREAEAVPLVERGEDKAAILAETGCSLALRRVTLAVEEGEIFVVIGLSGSGKSTLVRHVNRLIDPTAGEVRVDGRDVTRFDEKSLRDFRRHSVSMVFQNFGLMPHRSVLDNVAFGLVARGENREAARGKAREWIEIVGLSALTRADMQALLLDLQARLKKTVLFVTHDMDEALRLGNHLAVMRDGEVVQAGTPEEILAHPKDDYVARFVAVRGA
jgi:glycine betaine/proline transport system ATP-binding protein